MVRTVLGIGPHVDAFASSDACEHALNSLMLSNMCTNDLAPDDRSNCDAVANLKEMNETAAIFAVDALAVPDTCRGGQLGFQ